MNNSFISPYPAGYKTQTELSFEQVHVLNTGRAKSKNTQIKTTPQIQSSAQSGEESDSLWKFLAACGLIIFSTIIIYQMLEHKQKEDR